MESRRVIAVFDSAGAAQHARDSLLNLGLDREQIDIIDQSSALPGDGGTHRGVWAHLKEFFVPHDREALDESIRRGGYIVAAAVADDQADQAIQMLEREGAVDLEQRQAEWRTAGWHGSAEEDPATERLEQVDDTVRHTEVEIDDDRAGNIPSKDKGRTPRQK